MSNIGPLTTTFTAPSSCSYISVELVGSPSPTETSFYNYVGKVWPSPLDCFPSGYPNAYSDRFSNYYSPGICPSGWTAFPTSDYPDPAETTALCCPPGFTVIGDTTNLFASSFPCFTTNLDTAPATALVISGSIDINTKPYGDNPNNAFITSTDYIMPETGYSVFGVQVRYKTADFLPHSSTSSSTSAVTESTPSSSSQSTAVTSNKDTTTTASTTQSSASGNTTSNSTGLSNGAKIGIGVGIPLFFILVAIVLAFILIRRRRRRQRQPQPSAAADRNAAKTPDGYDEYKAELPGNKPGTSGGERYAGKVELANTVKPSELEDPTTQWPLSSQQPAHGSAVDLDAISSAHGTAHSDIGSETVSPMDTARDEIVPPGGPSRADEEEEFEQVKYRYIGEGSKVKKAGLRGGP